jgi:hypothetical protein
MTKTPQDPAQTVAQDALESRQGDVDNFPQSSFIVS